MHLKKPHRRLTRKSSGKLAFCLYGPILLVAIHEPRSRYPCKKVQMIPAKQCQINKPCIVPIQERQMDFAGPLNREEEHEIYLFSCIDSFFKYPSAEVFNTTNASNVIKLLDNHIQFHWLPRSLRLDQVRCLIGNQVKTILN